MRHDSTGTRPVRGRDRVLLRVLRWAPKRAFSTLAGALGRRRIPERLRGTLFRAFARRTGANLQEVELPLSRYPTFDAFFTRRLREGVRPIASDPEVVVSPCDGAVAESGVAVGGRMIQAKGLDYLLENLIPDVEAQRRFEGGAYVTIYLAPRDYHCVHFPAEGSVMGFQHIPGASFPVNAFAAHHIAGLYAMNERLVTFQQSPHGEIATVMIAAAGVGNMTLSYDAVETRARSKGRPGPRVRYPAPRPVERGEHLGAFHLGSTVILLFEPGRVKLLPMALGQRIRLGEPIARRVAVRGQGDAAA